MIDILYILRGLVYSQSFLWLYLIDKKYDVNNYFIEVLFPVSLGIIYLIVDMIGFRFSQYTNDLLLFYIFLMLYSYIVLRWRYSFYDSVCFTFLLVFINSYYWEFMLHFNAILFYGFNFNQFIQAFHLIPAYLLYRKIEIHNRSMFIKVLFIGLVISVLNLLELNFIINGIYIHNIFINLRRLSDNLTRFICLNLLLWIVIYYTKIIKKEGDIKLPFLDNKPN